MKHAFDIARNQVNFQVDPGALSQLAKCGVFNGMGNEIDADFAAQGLVGDAVDRQAHAVDGDRAFVSQVFAQRLRRQEAQLPAFTHAGEVRDAAHAIDMAGDDVAAQPVMRAQGFFKIDDARLGQAASLVQRFG